MKRVTFFAPAILCLLLTACGGSHQQDSSTATEETTVQDSIEQAMPPAPDKNPDGIAGYYVGFFEATEFDEKKRPSYSNKITIAIDSVADNTIYGHSVVAGNMRPFKGVYKAENKSYTVTAKEPGDDKYDGVFDFKLEVGKDSINGVWIANQKKLPVTKRQYALGKKEFKYDPNLELPEGLSGSALYDNTAPDEYYGQLEALTADVSKFNASKTLLKKEDVANMYKGDLEVIRNSIYARHGYSFKNRKMRYLFDSVVEWYMPMHTDVRNMLTEVERKNMDLLKRYEEHATKYYDEFGR